jgi:hypothetical protein
VQPTIPGLDPYSSLKGRLVDYSMSSPVSKKAKLNPKAKKLPANGGNKVNNKQDDHDVAWMEELAGKAFDHYRQYLNSAEAHEDGEGDTDEIEEMVQEVLKPHLSEIRPLKSLTNWQEQIKESQQHVSVSDLLPVLISVAYYHLADVAITEVLQLQQQQQQQTAENEEIAKEKSRLIEKIQELMQQSLYFFPENAAMWSMAANFGRMFQLIPPCLVCQWYERAVHCAPKARAVALNLLEEDSLASETVKEFTEALLLNFVAGVEYIVDEEEEEEEEEEEDIETEDKGEEEGYYSASSVEATSRFMAAMLHSTAGRHELALEHLKPFHLTHRLHPKLWQPDNGMLAKASNIPTPDRNYPVLYQAKAGTGGGVLPDSIYKRLCDVFAPKAAYWIESDYENRGYYSYFMDIPPAFKSSVAVPSRNDETKNQSDFQASNLLEDVIWNHLYPLVQRRLSKEKGVAETKIHGAEWWVHTRPIQANLGHNLHFDTDEALLKQDGQITHPIYSSVLYLTGGGTSSKSAGNGGGGATVVLDQTPLSEQVASQAWRCPPQDNTFLVFPGNLLHGVLPCPGSEQALQQETEQYKRDVTIGDDMDQDSVDTENIAQSQPKQWIPPKPNENTTSTAEHRLTFLVGFWTRCVPDKMKKRKLYGPCGPIPPRPSQTGSDDGQAHTWVDELYKGYETKPSNSEQPRSDLSVVELPAISPAWEVLSTEDEKAEPDAFEERTWLQLPAASIAPNHRFFVRGAPKFFHDCLFERSEEDDEEEAGSEYEKEGII